MASIGLNVSSYYSLGVRLYFDYSRDITRYWQWGISYETTRHATTSVSGLPRDAQPLELNHTIICGNIYRKVNTPIKGVHWRFGAGAGLIHAFWDESDQFGLALNLSAGLHIKLSRNVWLTTSVFPLLLPSNRIPYAFIRMPGQSHILSGSFFNIGFQARF